MSSPTHNRARLGAALCLGSVACLASLFACVGHDGGSSPPRAGSGTAGRGGGGTASCPAEQQAPALLPGVRPEHRTLDYWLHTLGSQVDLDEVVLSPDDVARQQAAYAALGGHPLRGQVDLLAPEDQAGLLAELNERFAYMHERMASGEYRKPDGVRPGEADIAAVAKLDALPGLGVAPRDELRVALEPLPLRCAPLPGSFYKAPELDKRFDRNNCSTAKAQEPVRVLARWPGGMLLVRNAYSLGFVAPSASLSQPLDAAHARAFVRGDKLALRGPWQLQGKGGATLAIADRLLLPAAAEGARRALFATAGGFDETAELDAEHAVPTRRPITRRAVLQEAWSYLDKPYGWGDEGGGVDCSRFIMDLFASFGLALPRPSGVQAQAGSMSIDLSGLSSERERLAVLDAAARRGIVLLPFPGHIMLYLGRDADGHPMAMHAFAEYLTPCAGAPADAGPGSETLFRVDRVQVSDLSLGKGSSRRSFLERVTQVVVMGQGPGPALLGAVTRRPPAPFDAHEPARCETRDDVALFVSPRKPSSDAPVRIIVSSSRDLGPIRLGLRGPDGTRQEPALHALGGPPFGYWAELEQPTVGAWSALVGEGSRVEGCQRFDVAARAEGKQAGAGPVWQPRRRWSVANENLFSTFVEQLFDYPPEQDLTWPNLQALLGSREHNILYNHLGQKEDERLELQPDCADMPYFLRAYFAWKMRLPFGFRHCNRGKSDRPPYCDDEIGSSLVDRQERDEVKAFAAFARRDVGDGVQSGNARTAPGDEHADHYPLPLTREALRPGTVFADPYGHVIMVADWLPQAVGKAGMLLGAESQPDGTIGRRRFWRGSFLFTPETTTAGAGFKAFRPLLLRGGGLRAVKNGDIAPSLGLPPWSDEQYRGSADDFYDKVEDLINPRPLEPLAVLAALLDALQESVERRVLSVSNAEPYKASHSEPIAMPEGYDVFETKGPWEDFATPSRDMRLLIAIDTVRAFSERLRRKPARFGLLPGPELEALVAQVQGELGRELARRRFAYVRSDGARFELSLQQVVDRGKAFEVGYNPNDCVELRWGAPDGSPEAATCRRHAPDEQRRRMESYRSWFAERRRPAR